MEQGNLAYRLSTAQEQSGTAIVNGRPHGFTWKEKHEVTFHFDTIEERKKFIRQVKHMWNP